MKKGDRWKRQIGILIREFRVLNGWTQLEFAARLRSAGFRRCSRALLSHIETGIATIRAHEIYYLRQVFDEDFEREFWKLFHDRQSRRSTTAKDPFEK